MIHCFVNENKGIMDKRCIKRLKELLPGPKERKVELVSARCTDCMKRELFRAKREVLLFLNSFFFFFFYFVETFFLIAILV